MTRVKRFNLAIVGTLLAAGLSIVPAASAWGTTDTTDPGGGGGSLCHTTGGVPCPRGCWGSGVHGEAHGDYLYFYKYTGRDGSWYHYDVAVPWYPSPARQIGVATKFCG
jgi:hypothetical protein